MSNKLEQKKQIVTEITEKIRDSQSAVLVDYRGLDVAQITELRKNLRDEVVDYKVYKNTMTRRAVAEAELEGLDDIIAGPTAIAFGLDDVVAPARILNDFAKENKELEIKGGIIEGEVATLEEIKELATLPSHEGLLSMLLSVLQAPMRNMAYVTKAIAEQKEESGEEAE